MSLKIIKQDELDQVGLRLFDGKLHEFKDKMYTSAVEIGGDKMRSIYVTNDLQLRKQDYLGLSIPRSWVFIEMEGKTPDDIFYMLGEEKSKLTYGGDKKNNLSRTEYAATIGARNVTIGDTIQLRDRKGEFLVLFRNAEKVVVTNDFLHDSYVRRERKTPSALIDLDNIYRVV